VSLRTKLLIGYATFTAALVVLGAWSARALSQMSAVSGRIIAENYDSVVAARDMKESLERQDSAASFELIGQHERALGPAARHRAGFDAALEKAAHNITEVGEADIIAAIRRSRDDYARAYDEFLRAGGDRHALYFEQLDPRFAALNDQCDRLLHVNQEAMRRKAAVASQTARRWSIYVFAFAFVLVSGGVGGALALSASILRPVRQLSAAIAGMAGGDLDATAEVSTHDEIGALAEGFNRMAARILATWMPARSICGRTNWACLRRVALSRRNAGNSQRRDRSQRGRARRSSDASSARTVGRVLAAPGRAPARRLFVE
jgi:HAMP domain-containing protein